MSSVRPPGVPAKSDVFDHGGAEVLRRAMAVSALGAAVGLAGALAASRVIASLLFQVSPTDPVALAAACAALLVVALIAAYLPARHASRVDPARALQAE
jgi:putative ABC transport system permease protein